MFDPVVNALLHNMPCSKGHEGLVDWDGPGFPLCFMCGAGPEQLLQEVREALHLPNPEP